MTDGSRQAAVYLVDRPADFRYLPGALGNCGDMVALTRALDPRWILAGYSVGLFPWFEQDGLFHWFSPDPRWALAPGELAISRSLRKRLAQAARGVYAGEPCEIAVDRDTPAVIEACARAYRPGQRDTWITESFKRAYGELAQAGVVHSVEVYVSGTLAGGLWGTAVGATFTGESMFHTRTDCSKISFAALNAVCKAIGIKLIDCQAESDHIVSLGARPIPRGEYTEQALANAREPMAAWERVRNRPVNVLLKQLAAQRAYGSGASGA